MTAIEVKKAYSELPEKEQVLVASFIATDLMTKDSEFATKLSRRNDEMNSGYKHTHKELLELHDKMEKEGL